MEGLIPRIFVNWQPKVTALVTALVVWLLVSNAMTTTKVIGNVAVRIVNIPPNKTVVGMGSNGLLRQRLTLTVTGNKDALDRLEHGDLEVVIDATGKESEWIGSVGRRNLISHNPEVNVAHHIDHIRYSQFIVHLTDLVTERVPVRINVPRGEPPAGYQFLDVWPRRLYHTVSGPREKLDELRKTGLELTFDLSSVSLSELDALSESQGFGADDEVRLPVPESWKLVTIPFLAEEKQPLNDPEAADLHIEFLRRELLPVAREIPVRVYYPLSILRDANPGNLALMQNDLIRLTEGIFTLSLPLYAQDVSRLFLDVCRDQLEIVVIASTDINQPLRWAVQLVDPWRLEDEYVRRMLPVGEETTPVRERFLRERFRAYMQQFSLYKRTGEMLRLESIRTPEGMMIEDVTLNQPKS